MNIVEALANPVLPCEFGGSECPSCHVVLLYEDVATGKQAMDLLHPLAHRLWNNFHFEYRLWNLDLLRVPHLKTSAVQDAAHADLLLFAAHESCQLAGEAKAWFEAWLSHRSARPCALIALIEDSAIHRGSPHRLPLFLQDVARRGRLDFFLKRIATRAVPPKWSPPVTVGGTRRMTLVLEQVLQQNESHPGWGINE